MPDSGQQQLLHLVIGGELTDLDHITFKDLDQVEIVGVYPNYATAYAAWNDLLIDGRVADEQTGTKAAFDDVFLKYGRSGEQVINLIERVSKPGWAAAFRERMRARRS